MKIRVTAVGIEDSYYVNPEQIVGTVLEVNPQVITECIVDGVIVPDWYSFGGTDNRGEWRCCYQAQYEVVEE